MPASGPVTTTTLSTTEGALRLWREIVRGLQAAGYANVVPEYLKLSRALSQVKMTELLQGVPEAEHWTELRQLALEALKSLDPLVEAARVLAQLPSEFQAAAPIPPVITSQPLLSDSQPSILAGEPEAPVSAKPTNAIRKRRSSQARTSVIPSPNGAVPRGKKTVVSKSKPSARRGRVKSRD